MLSRMGFTRPMGRAEDTVGLPLEGVMAIVEVYACSALVHVRAPLGRAAQKAVDLPLPCFVRTCETGCADDTVLLPLEGVMAIVEVDACSVLFHVRASFGRRTQKV